MPRHRLSITSTFTGTRLMAAVAISWLFIWNDPSPATHTTVLSGHPMAAPTAAGKPKPMVPRPPDEMKLRGTSRSTCWAAHIWCCPTSVTTMLRAGSSARESCPMTVSGTISPGASPTFGW